MPWQGISTAPIAELAASVSRAESLGYPQNAFNRAMTYFMQIWVRLEAGQIEEAITLVAGLRRLSEQSGLDLWRFVGATEHVTVKAVAALTAGADAATLAAGAHNIAARVDGVAIHRPQRLSDVPRCGDRPTVDRRRRSGSGQDPIGHVTAARGGDGYAFRGRRADAPARAHLRRTTRSAGPHWTTHWPLRASRVRRCSNCVACSIISIWMPAGSRAELAAVVERIPDGARWPELARAERILS